MSSSPPPPLLVLIGPTAVGKTALSFELAQRFDGEIISADSRLFYRGMNIGTAKPTPAEQALVPHHLIDICDPNETLTLGDFQRIAYAAINDCHARGKTPIMAGGTGQYVMSVVEGWGIPEVSPHPELRKVLEALGRDELARWLIELDPVAAERIDLKNPRRTIRALEVTLLSGQPISKLQEKTPPPYSIKIVGLQREREALYRRIDERVDHMLADGLLNEIHGLLEQGYNFDLPAMSGLGYRQFRTYFEEDSSESALQHAIERVKFETHRFVRHQNTWFRQDDERIAWFDTADPDLIPSVIDHIQNWLA